mmetsp:Transcript_30093/g.77524  ORF Transcript_30093/g.77524 Transcript_30093/m.77524 type:complete len:207 (+) Transcript_30093:1158-1778(+)
MCNAIRKTCPACIAQTIQMTTKLMKCHAEESGTSAAYMIASTACVVVNNDNDHNSSESSSTPDRLSYGSQKMCITVNPRPKLACRTARKRMLCSGTIATANTAKRRRNTTDSQSANRGSYPLVRKPTMHRIRSCNSSPECIRLCNHAENTAGIPTPQSTMPGMAREMAVAWSPSQHVTLGLVNNLELSSTVCVHSKVLNRFRTTAG